MKAEITKKPTNHVKFCLLSNKQIEKGEEVIKITQRAFPGEHVGYISLKYINMEELKNVKTGENKNGNDKPQGSIR